METIRAYLNINYSWIRKKNLFECILFHSLFFETFIQCSGVRRSVAEAKEQQNSDVPKDGLQPISTNSCLVAVGGNGGRRLTPAG